MTDTTETLVFKASIRGGKYVLTVHETETGYRLTEATHGKGQYTSMRDDLDEMRRVVWRHMESARNCDGINFHIDLGWSV